eukprot:CAMPEP_0169135762 /NCGR_PEP_ID=MMETSP1015-20121227/40617_1 /TAXON_ID=342587 /ORGANISM="Karlodinium micrum, Strain CCMP2283" /LENGTH=140 /DNA_ID=CAMNT_0009200439 /DNA_START=214 /DNA_END=636 /DNA_ORIENTATION=+
MQQLSVEAAGEQRRLLRKEPEASEINAQVALEIPAKGTLQRTPKAINSATDAVRIVRRKDGTNAGMSRITHELILEDELEKAESLAQASEFASLPAIPHAAPHEEEENGQHEANEDEDEEDRRRFGVAGPGMTTASPRAA